MGTLGSYYTIVYTDEGALSIGKMLIFGEK